MTSISSAATSQRYVVPKQDNPVTETIIKSLAARYHTGQYNWSESCPPLVTKGRSVRSILQEFPNIEKPIVTAFRAAKKWATEAFRFSLLLSISVPIIIPTAEWMLGKLASPLTEIPNYAALSLMFAAVAIPTTTLFGACKSFYTQRQNIKSGLAQAEDVRARSLHMIQATRRARSIMQHAV